MESEDDKKQNQRKFTQKTSEDLEKSDFSEINQNKELAIFDWWSTIQYFNSCTIWEHFFNIEDQNNKFKEITKDHVELELSSKITLFLS